MGLYENQIIALNVDSGNTEPYVYASLSLSLFIKYMCLQGTVL